MGDWGSVLREIDDDYLVGISNKGIVKRAYKDMETTVCKVSGDPAEDMITVSVGEETVHIKIPLGESTCSCPSRSICRHVVLGILSLQKASETKDADSETVGEEESIESSQADDTMAEKVLQQIADYPIGKLAKSLGVRRLQQLIENARIGNRPQITYASAVTVQPLTQATEVRLLYPLEYSTCTCHKKEFCVHKAEAVLWCKLESGQTNIEALEQNQDVSAEYDMEQIQDAVLQMKAFLEELLDTGLSRTPHDALDRMERLAMICHNAKLPDFESDWRRLQDSYSKYLRRAASLRIQKLLWQFTSFYRQVELLGNAQNALEVSRLAGAFRAEYSLALDLDLVGIAIEHFVSRSGYEGETIYFLEENTKKWYTYTQARPVFYDNAYAINSARQQYPQETPWRLGLPFHELAFWHIHLEQAKCDNRGRLSSSKETKGQLLQDRRTEQNMLTADILGKWYYHDFAQLFEELFQDGRTAPEKSGLPGADSTSRTKLVFLGPVSCGKAVFLETEQKLYMDLYDASGKVVVVEVAYSENEAEGIRYLEKITDENLPCFFGRVYLRDGRLRLYPISVFNRNELSGTG